jgi:hypothetical protein
MKRNQIAWVVDEWFFFFALNLNDLILRNWCRFDETFWKIFPTRNWDGDSLRIAKYLAEPISTLSLVGLRCWPAMLQIWGKFFAGSSKSFEFCSKMRSFYSKFPAFVEFRLIFATYFFTGFVKFNHPIKNKKMKFPN